MNQATPRLLFSTGAGLVLLAAALVLIGEPNADTRPGPQPATVGSTQATDR